MVVEGLLALCPGQPVKDMSNRRDLRTQRHAYLIIDEAPLLEEGMNTHDSTNISGKVSSACGDGEIFRWAQPGEGEVSTSRSF